MPENGAGKENGAENETEDVNEDENGNGGTVAEDNNTVTGCVSNLNSAQEVTTTILRYISLFCKCFLLNGMS